MTFVEYLFLSPQVPDAKSLSNSLYHKVDDHPHLTDPLCRQTIRLGEHILREWLFLRQRHMKDDRETYC